MSAPTVLSSDVLQRAPGWPDRCVSSERVGGDVPADGDPAGLGECLNRARDVAAQLRSGTVGHNAFRTDFGIAFGGFKQSGIGREGGIEGLRNYLETKTVILEGRPTGYEEQAG